MKIIKYLLVLIIVFACSLTIYLYSFYKSSVNYHTKEDKAIEINIGEDSFAIGQKLEQEKLVKSSYGFAVFYLLNRPLILPGKHLIPANSDIQQISNILGENPNKEIEITFPEGLTSNEIIEKIASKTNLKIQDINASLQKNWHENIDIKFDNNKNLEGFLFPDTYRFKYDSTPQEIIEKLLDNFDNKWQKIYNEYGEQELSDYELLKLASIIEKEAKNNSQKKIIAGIFYNRLKIDMPLQSCATIQYILPERKEILSEEDTKNDSPYNTYLYAGLPPTPISNPGADSIEAVFNPENTDFLYFLHDSAGEIHYAATYEEHQKNIEKYLNNN